MIKCTAGVGASYKVPFTQFCECLKRKCCPSFRLIASGLRTERIIAGISWGDCLKLPLPAAQPPNYLPERNPNERQSAKLLCTVDLHRCVRCAVCPTVFAFEVQFNYTCMQHLQKKTLTVHAVHLCVSCNFCNKQRFPPLNCINLLFFVM
jgi:hypothetical protein